MNALSTIALLLSLTLPAAAAATDLDRSRPVPAGPARPFSAPAVQEATLANGVKLALAEVKRLPIVSVDIVLPRAGEAVVPPGKSGLAGLVGKLINEGAGGLDSKAFAEALDDIGVSIGVSVSDDAMKLSIFATKETLDQAMKLAASMVRKPDLPAGEFDRLKQEALIGVQQRRGDPGAMAQERLSRRIYGSHPYGAEPTETSIGSLTHAEVRSFAAAALRPEGAIIAASGDVSLPEFEKLAAKHFGSWRAQPGAAIPAAPAAVAAVVGAPGLLIDVVDMPGSQQSAIRAGHLSIARGDPDYFPVAVMNYLLGRAPIVNRLERNLREQHGWAYSARLAPEYKAQGGGFVVDAGVQTDVTAAALREILKELRRVQDERVTDEELGAVKRLMAGAYAMGLQTVQAVAARVADNELYGRRKDELATYRAQVLAVTPDQIQDAARRHLSPDALQVVISGDAAQIVPELSKLGQVRVFDVQGNLVSTTPAAPAGPAKQAAPGAGK